MLKLAHDLLTSMTIMHTKPFIDHVRKELIELLLEQVVELRGYFNENDLNWAIKMEDAYKKQGNLSNKQINVLVQLIQKYREDEGEDEDELEDFKDL